MIIGLTGQMQSGKDTVGAYLVEHHGFTRLAFADKLKEAVANLLDISIEEVNTYKMQDQVSVSIHTGRADQFYSLKTFTFRGFLQRFGTEMARETFWYDFWLDLVFNGIEENVDYVITDVRFKNEAERIKSHEGFILRLYRTDFYKDPGHLSEQELPYDLIDVTVVNDATIPDLYKAARDALYSLGVFV